MQIYDTFFISSQTSFIVQQKKKKQQKHKYSFVISTFFLNVSASLRKIREKSNDLFIALTSVEVQKESSEKVFDWSRISGQEVRGPRRKKKHTHTSL